MRATTSLPDPVGPRISTEMSDLAAVRIHSKTISIFSSRPIISRKRCTDGDWSSVLTGRAPLEEMVEQLERAPRSSGARPYTAAAGSPATTARRRSRRARGRSSPRPAQPPERLHQRFDVEALVGPRAEVAQDAGAQRRLHQAAEPRLEVRRLGRSGRAGRAGAPGAEGQIIHLCRWRYRPRTAAADRGTGGFDRDSSRSDSARSGFSSPRRRLVVPVAADRVASRRWSR